MRLSRHVVSDASAPRGLPLLCLTRVSRSYSLLLGYLVRIRRRSRIRWVFFHSDDYFPYVEIGRSALAWPWLSVEGAQLQRGQLLSS